MSFTDFREVSSPTAGTATTYGSQDLLDIMQIFNGKTVGTKRPRINNPWLWLGSQDLGESTEPGPPAAGIQRMWVDSSDHHIKMKNSSNVIVDITAGGTPGTWNAATAETITNKTINATNNTITDVSTALGDLLKSNGTKFIRMARGTANQALTVNGAGTDLQWTTLATGGDMVLANTQTNTGAKTFNDTTLLLRNPANTFSATLGSGAQTAARTFTLPVTTSDTIQTIAATQTVTNKTLQVDLNTVSHSTTNAAGDLLKGDGTKFQRLARGTANQVLSVNAGGTDVVWATPAGGGNVSTTSSNTYGDFDQIFRSTRLIVTNPANTFNYLFVGSAITATRSVTLPLLTADDTFQMLAATQTPTNKTINASNNTITDNATAAGDLLKSDGTKFTRLPMGAANQVLTVNAGATDILWAAAASGGGNVSTGQVNTYGDFDQTFRSGRLDVTNPANTFSYSITGSAITAARALTIPLLTADDTIVTAAFIQTLTNKTVSDDLNTINDSVTNAAGDILKNNGTKYIRFPRGSANQVLSVNAGGTDLVWATPAGGGNVSTTSSNTYGDFDQIFRSTRVKIANPANTFNYSIVASAITAARNITLPLLTADDNLVTEAFAQTLTNKTISGASNTISNIPDSALSANVNLLNTSQTITAADTFNDQTLKLRNPANTFSYTLVHGAITADRTLTLPAITANDTIETTAATQTVTNKTLSTDLNTLNDSTTNAAGDILKSNGTKFVRLARGAANQVLTVNSGGTDIAWAAGGGGGSSNGYPANILTVASDGSGDFTTLQAAITAAGVGAVIYVGPGDFTTGSTIDFTGKDRISVIGCGQGVTRFVTTSTSIQGVTGFGSTSGSSLALTANSLKKSNTITLSTANAGTLAVNDWILLRSNKIVDVEFSPNFLAGEMHQVRAVNTGTGVVTLGDRVVEDYLTTDTASCIKILMIEDITIQDCTFMTNTTTGANTLHNGWIDFRFGRNIRFQNVEVTNVGWAGIMLESCVAPIISNCNIHDINFDSASQFLNYGIVLHSATRDAIISNCYFRRTRHALTMGGDSGTNFEGYVLNALITNCISVESNTAHFDSHQACRFVTYVNCKAAGGAILAGSGATAVYGFQTRSPYTKFLECTAVDIPGRGIYVYGDISSATAPNKADDCVIENCDFINTALDTGGAGGQAIWIENFIQRPRITECRISNSAGIPITLNQENDNAAIQNNLIFNATATTFTAVDTYSCDDVIFTGNRISGTATPIRVNTQATRPVSNNWIIDGNDFTGCTSAQFTMAAGSTNIRHLVGSTDVCTNNPNQTA